MAMPPDPRLADVALTVNERLQDLAIRHMLYMQQVSGHEANQVLRFLNDDVFPDVLEQVRRRLESMELRGFDRGVETTRRLRLLAARIDDIIGDGLRETGQVSRERLVEIAKTEANWQVARFRETMPFVASFGTPSASLLRSIVNSRPMQGRLLRVWWRELETGAKAVVRQQINIGLVEGESVAQIAARLRGTAAGRFADGTFETIRRDAVKVVRTAANHVVNDARQATYRANADIIKGYQWVATLDDRTCPICGGLDGQVFPLESPKTRQPPAHINCRCSTVPVTKSFRELGLDADEPTFTRAARSRIGEATGQVPATVTYPEWLRRQPVDVQNDALGITKAQLFRSGRLEIRQFSDRGRVLSLEALRRKFDLPED
jgi:SPP1 gp7 family putative phage head morphogenesis protein